MFVAKKLLFSVLFAVYTVHATTIPSADVKAPPPPPQRPTKSTSSHTTSHSTSSAATSTGFVFSTPPASLHAPATLSEGRFFSTDFLKAFYPGFGPTQTSVEPQPIMTDPVNGFVFPLDLTNPKTIPTQNVMDPVVFPPSLLTSSPTIISPLTNLSTAGSIKLREAAVKDITSILQNTTGNFGSSCSQCVSSLSVLKQLALAAPWEVPPALISICELTESPASCLPDFSANADGDILTQIVYNADVTGADGQSLCAKGVFPLHKSCPAPAPIDLTEILKTWFAKPKPKNAVAPPPSGKKPLNVYHVSDFHIDPRYTIGSESNCDQFLCCRPTSNTSAVPPGQILAPAPRFGAYECDTPWLLADAAMHAMHDVAADVGLDFAIFTGDLTSHDGDNQLSREYVEYVETSVYQLFKRYLDVPVYAALGNHDTWPQASDSPHNAQGPAVAEQFQWDYDHLAEIWNIEGWIDEQTAQTAKAMYSAYSMVTPQGLKIITLNTDFWYASNHWNHVNLDNPDNSGMLRFLTDELQAAEDAGQRVWIMGHVLAGFDGGNAMPNPANLLYQIIDRFTPHVIANVFMGHIHDEVRYLYYANNGTVMNASTAAATTWVGPSLSNLQGLNTGWSLYQVDPDTFDIMEAFDWYANVSDFAEADRQGRGIEYVFEYSTRDDYGIGFDWPKTAPLNATWWHMVTESMETNPSLVDKFTLNQGRQSALTQNCTSTECQQAKICYIRSGSPPIAARCTPGFASVQVGN